MYKSIELIKAKLDAKEIKYSVEEMGERTVLYVGFGIDNGPGIRLQFIATDEDNDIAVRLFGLIRNISEDKADKMLHAINECNAKFRYVKIVLDNENDINMEYDLPLNTSDSLIGEVAFEMIIRMLKIANECYPMLMKVIWG